MKPEVVSVSPYEWPFKFSPDGKPLHVADLADEIWVAYKRAVEEGHRAGAPLEGFCHWNKKWMPMQPKAKGEEFYWKTTEYRLGAWGKPVLDRGTRIAVRQADGTVRYFQQPSSRTL